MNPFAYIDPRRLPKWARRLFVLTLPISGPLWCVAAFVLAVVTLVVAAVFCCVALLAMWLGEVWDGPRRRPMAELPAQARKLKIGDLVEIIGGPYAGEQGWVVETYTTSLGAPGYGVKLTTGPDADKAGTALCWERDVRAAEPLVGARR